MKKITYSKRYYFAKSKRLVIGGTTFDNQTVYKTINPRLEVNYYGWPSLNNDFYGGNIQENLLLAYLRNGIAPNSYKNSKFYTPRPPQTNDSAYKVKNVWIEDQKEMILVQPVVITTKYWLFKPSNREEKIRFIFLQDGDSNRFQQNEITEIQLGNFGETYRTKFLYWPKHEIEDATFSISHFMNNSEGEVVSDTFDYISVFYTL